MIHIQHEEQFLSTTDSQSFNKLDPKTSIYNPISEPIGS
jgi:hypothetical protein